MNILRRMNGRALVIAFAITSMALAAACGGDTDSGSSGPAGPAGQEGPAGLAALSLDSDAERARAAATAAPMSTPQPPGANFSGGDEDGPDLGDSGSAKDLSSVLEQQVAQTSQERIIVRSVDMAVEVTNVSDTIQEIGQIGTLNGGWTVRTQHIQTHRGLIDIRVPADRLDDTLMSLRQISDNIKSEVSTSQDFTEEFTDTNARITTLQDTVAALRVLFERAVEIEDALEIQREITRIQSDLEALQARINFLSESSAFSLISVEVLALPQSIEVDAGEDVLAAAGGAVRFRAKFTPPEGIEDFRIEWDFGDGSTIQSTNRVAPFNTEGMVISAPVVHSFADDIDSPYIVTVTVNGTGESGASDGEDVMVVTVTRVPPIDVFPGTDIIAEEGDTVKFRGNFTRPGGVTDLVYIWDFGDGSAPLRVEVGPEDTVATAEHAYANYRPQSYQVILTVKGETEAGSTEGKAALSVRVNETESLDSGSFTPGDTGRDAFQILSAIGKWIGNALVFLAVLSPIWIILAIIGFVVYKLSKRNMAKPSRTGASKAPPAETPAS